MPASWNSAMDASPVNARVLINGKSMANPNASAPLQRTFAPEEGVDDWGFDARQQEEMVEALRKELEARGAVIGRLDFYTLLRFLRARDYEVDRAASMLQDHLQWRQENRVNHILEEFTFNEREEFLSVYPQGYHKTDKKGHPIYIQHIGKVDLTRIREVTSEDRMLKYHIQEYERCLEFIFPIVSKLHGRKIDQTFAIMDVKGIGLYHLTGEVRRILSKITSVDQNNYPETLYHTCIINAPATFRAIWGVVKPLLNKRTQDKIEVCPRDYMPTLKRWINEEDIPEYLGGKSKGTLVDDVGPWKDHPELIRQMEEQRDSFKYPKSDQQDMVQRQFSSLSSTTVFEDAVPHPSWDDMGQSTFLGGDEFVNLPDEQDVSSASPAIDLSGVNLTAAEGIPAEKADVHSLATRIHDLEKRLPEQVERLKTHMNRANASRVLRPPPATLMGRVEVLEQGMEILLAAQESAWQNGQRKANSEPPSGKCCSFCCIM